MQNQQIDKQIVIRSKEKTLKKNDEVIKNLENFRYIVEERITSL